MVNKDGESDCFMASYLFMIRGVGSLRTKDHNSNNPPIFMRAPMDGSALWRDSSKSSAILDAIFF
jgi:hypothetical protein